MTLAIIDLGSNSVRFDVYELSAKKPPKRLHREKIMVRLGDGAFLSGKLSTMAISRAKSALQSFASQIKSYRVDRTIAFATSALRDVSDQKDFLKMIEQDTSIAIKVISGEEEARLIAKGILAHEFITKEHFALVDIGGGSTEISLCKGQETKASFSFDLGVNRLQQIFLKDTPPKPSPNYPDPIEALKEHVTKLVSSKIQSWPETRLVMGSSGTIKALSKLIEADGKKTEPFKRKSLERIVARIHGMSLEELSRVPGMDPKRTDLIVPGALVFFQILTLLKAKRVYTTDYSLRDGILEEELESFRKKHG